MELTCPACRTRYGVPDAQIPRTGRVVRCSACNAEWIARASAPGAETRTPPEPTPPQSASITTPPETDRERPAPSRSEPDLDWRNVAARPDLSGRLSPAREVDRERPRAPASRLTAEPDRRESTAAMAASLEGDHDGDMDERRRGAGGAFMAGFALVALIALAAAVAYVKRDDIAVAVPALADPLAAYADTVDRGRLALDSLADAARSWIGQL